MIQKQISKIELKLGSCRIIEHSMYITLGMELNKD